MCDRVKNFLDGAGRLKICPAKRRARLHALRYLAEKFEAGQSYTEKETNELLNRWHCFGDPATLRRALCDTGLLTRDREGRSYQVADVLPTAESLEANYL